MNTSFAEIRPAGVQIAGNLSLIYFGVGPSELRQLSEGEEFAIVYSRGGKCPSWQAIEFAVLSKGYQEQTQRSLTPEEKAYMEHLLAQYRQA